MSEEERDALRNFKSEYETCNHNSSDLIIELDDAKIILNLIEKQQKEMVEENNYISKDKIKAKIAEYDKKKKDIPHEIDLKAFYTISDIRNIQIDVLESLLEED